MTGGKVQAVINAVLSLVDKKANKLPARTTVIEMNLERLLLAQRQLADVFSPKQNTTLLTDETSKFGKKFMGYEASDEAGNLWVLGLRDIETKSAEDTLKVFKELLQDLDDVVKNAEGDISKSVLQHVQATMSDRAATEVKFNSLLETYRKEALPVIVDNWASLTESEKNSLEKMSNFFCGLHSLVNLATTCQAALVETEKGLFGDDSPIFDKSFAHEKEAGTTRFIRTACKAFAMGADDKSGCFGAFNLHMKPVLKEHCMHSLPILPYRGTRFNILFENASGVFFLHKHMEDFLQNYMPMNRLLNAVLHDLRIKHFVAGAKALGLIGKLVTSPLWSLLEDKTIHILDMNDNYSYLLEFLHQASENPGEFMEGKLQPFPNRVRHDGVLDALLKPCDPEVDSAVQIVLSVLFPAMARTCKQLFKDHLPGGKWQDAGEEVRAKTKSVPKSSKFAESVFGALDHLIRAKPNISTISAEAYIMFANNKTMEWLRSKDEHSQRALISDSRKAVKEVKKKFKERLLSIEEGQRKQLEEKLKKKKEAAKAKLLEQERCTDDIIHHGLWQSHSEINNMLATYDKVSEKKAALKAQLQFRKEVLHQCPEDKSLFCMSKKQETKRRQLTIEELTENLKELVHQAAVRSDTDETHMLVGKRGKHYQVEKQGDKGERKAYKGKIVSQVRCMCR